MVLGPQYGAHGVVPSDLAVLFSNAAAANGPSPVARRVVPVKDCRTIRSRDLVRHGTVGRVEVSDDGSAVTFEGEALTMSPVASVPVSRLHYW